MTGFEKRSATVGLTLLVALSVTYGLLFDMSDIDRHDYVQLTVLLGLAYIAGYTRIVIPRRRGVTTFNIREASYSLLLIGGDPKFVIPALLVLRIHQWWLTGSDAKWRLLTAATGVETILLHTWLFHYLGILGSPESVTPAIVVDAMPFMAVSALLSFVVFSLVHPANSVKQTATSVPVRVVLGVTLMGWTASVLGMLFFLPENAGAYRTIETAGPLLLLGLAAAVTLQQFNRSQFWTQASRLINDWRMDPEQIRQLLLRVRRLNPSVSQILLVEDRESGVTYRAWSRGLSVTCQVDVVDRSLSDVLSDYPESGVQVSRKDKWNLLEASGWMTSDTSRSRVALIQIAPPVQVLLLPTLPQNGRTYLSLPAESILDQLSRALQQYAVENQARSGLATTLRNLTEGFTTVDDSGIIRSWNRAMERISGVSEREAAGTPLSALLHDSEVAGVDDEPLLSARRPDGSVAVLHATRSDLDVNGEHIAIYTVRDVSETVAMVESRNQFFAFVAHELKSPIMTLYMQSDELEDRLGENDQLVLAFQHSVDQLAGHLSDMSTASETGTRYAKVHTNARTLSARQVLEYPWLDRTREIFPRIWVHELGDFKARVDVLRSQQVLTNLVDNALKYSPATKPILLEFGVAPGSECGFFRVTDEGIGVPAEVQGRVFEAHFRADNTGSTNGDGLGLSLSRNLARQMGGDLTYAPGAVRGSIFTFHVPLAIESEPEEQVPCDAHADTGSVALLHNLDRLHGS